MSYVIVSILSLMIGGTFGILIMCMIYINHLNDHESQTDDRHEERND